MDYEKSWNELYEDMSFAVNEFKYLSDDSEPEENQNVGRYKGYQYVLKFMNKRMNKQ